MTVKNKKMAVALRYRQGADSAPRVVAKGNRKIAEKIIAIAKEHGVPVHEDRDLVEVLSTLKLSEEIPPDLYKAVAEVLAFIYSVSKRV